jgi:hypothetical protein
MNTEENKKTKFTAMVATGIVGIFFLGSTTFLYVGNNNLKEENKVITEKVETLTSVKAQLELELKAIDAELSQYKGKNRELDQLLSGAYKELNLKKAKIEKLSSQNASLSKYKKEAESLRKLKINYLAQIKEMEEKINVLTAENKSLKYDNARLTDEMKILMSNYMMLERKVEIASVLKVDKVLASAEKKSKNGKYSKVFNAKKTDRLVVNFELSENMVADKAEKNIYVRIIDPSGNVLPAPANEKGYFTNPDGNMEMPYSLAKKVDYNNEKLKSTTYYGVGNTALKEGLYTIEFYCEGYFCGASKYKLK